jgi:FkbM family methyltransferase
MKTILQTLEAFFQNKLVKPDFIREMYENHHSKLFEYAEYLPKTNIKKIEIEDGRVVMTSRDYGLRMLCPPNDFRVAPIETLNFFKYEQADADIMDRLVGTNSVFLDIGANMGWYSINVALSRPNATVHCFEPIPPTFDYLTKNIKLNNVSNITAHNFGFSNEVGEFDFYFYEEGSGNASARNVSGRDDVKVFKCKVDTLDRYAANLNQPIDFVKCDVEGAELFVFKGGLQTIARDKPIIFSEILRKWSEKFNYDPNEIFDLFESLDYQAFTAEAEGLKKFKKMDHETIETNFFFLHKQKHAEQIREIAGIK